MYPHEKFDHDFEGNVEPSTCFLVCSVPRSGSSLLCEGLCDTGLAGAPTEFFDGAQMRRLADRWGTESFDEYLEALLRKKTSANGIFGVKAHFPQLASAFPDGTGLERFPDLRCVYITRNDRVRQAVSFTRAALTGEWASLSEPSRVRPRFDYEHIKRHLDQIRQQEDQWEAFFLEHRIEPLRIAYEDLAAAYEDTVRIVLEHLDIELPEDQHVAVPFLKKQADRLSEKWVQRYLLFDRHGPSLASAPFFDRLRVRLESGVHALVRRFIARGAGGAPDPVGFIDSVHEDERGLHVIGWFTIGGRSVDGIELETRSGGSFIAASTSRPDIVAVFSQLSSAEQSGFEALLPSGEDCEFTLRARQGRSFVYHCRIQYRRRLAGLSSEGWAFPPNAGTLEL
jgi:trehalose 2-sulfotransferase